MTICPDCDALMKRISPDSPYLCPKCNRLYPTNETITYLAPSRPLDTTVSFPSNSFEQLLVMEESHFWFKARGDILENILATYIKIGSKFLEIGCGNGYMLARLAHIGASLHGADLFLDALKFCRTRLPSIPLFVLDINNLPFKEEFDSIGIFDVLEHIEDDSRALSQIHKALKPGGYLLVTVPAYQFLWGPPDTAAFHKRRYTKKQLSSKLRNAGFKVDRLIFFNSFLFPLLVVSRILQKNISSSQEDLELQIPSFLNKILGKIMSAEKEILRWVNFPVGGSLLAICHKG